MATSPTDLVGVPGEASLFLDAWVDAGSEAKAVVVAGRAADRARLPAGALELVGFDESRELWKFSGVIVLPAPAAEGGCAALRIVNRLARSVSVSGPQELEDGRWSLEGHAVEADLVEPGLSFVSFSARSMSSP
jgi:hypothetical protein